MEVLERQKQYDMERLMNGLKIKSKDSKNDNRQNPMVNLFFISEYFLNYGFFKCFKC